MPRSITRAPASRAQANSMCLLASKMEPAETSRRSEEEAAADRSIVAGASVCPFGLYIRAYGSASSSPVLSTATIGARRVRASETPASAAIPSSCGPTRSPA